MQEWKLFVRDWKSRERATSFFSLSLFFLFLNRQNESYIRRRNYQGTLALHRQEFILLTTLTEESKNIFSHLVNGKTVDVLCSISWVSFLFPPLSLLPSRISQNQSLVAWRSLIYCINIDFSFDSQMSHLGKDNSSLLHWNSRYGDAFDKFSAVTQNVVHFGNFYVPRFIVTWKRANTSAGHPRASVYIGSIRVINVIAARARHRFRMQYDVHAHLSFAVARSGGEE